MRCLFTAAVLVGAAVLAGCGPAPPKLVSVTGKVVQKDTGLSAGVVYLHPAAGNTWVGEPPSSQLELDGSFTIATYPHGKGAPPGEWKVTLSPSLANRIQRPDYAKPERTPLSLKVPDEGVSGHTFEVK